MFNELVSVVIPFYNNEGTLEEAIKSVFNQSYQNWELILLNDGSKDNSLKIAKSVNDKRVSVFDDGVNRGLVYRLNQAPSLARGNYIVRMDADDLMHPDRIKKQMAVFAHDDSVDLVDTGTYSITENGEPQGVRGNVPISNDPRYVVANAMLLHASIVGKKEWFEKNKYDPDFIRAEDYELWIRTYKKSKFLRVQEALYIVREGKVNIKNYNLSINTVLKILKKYGPEVYTSHELKLLLLKTSLKKSVYKIFGFFNAQDVLSKKRNRPLGDDEKKELQRILDEIRGVVLPIE